MQNQASKLVSALFLVLAGSTFSIAGIASKATTIQPPAPGSCVAGVADVQAKIAKWQVVIANVKAGDRIQLSASGSWHWGADQPVGTSPAVGPAGAAINPDSITDTSALITPQSSVGTLIGKFGDNGIVFEVKKQVAATSPSDGPVLMMMNDAKGAFADNSGYVTVHYSICPAQAATRH